MNMAQLGKHTLTLTLTLTRQAAAHEHGPARKAYQGLRALLRAAEAPRLQATLTLTLAPSPSLTPDPDPNPNPTPTPNPNLPICRSVGPSGMRHLQVGVAPEPSDVFWDNLELSKRDRISWCRLYPSNTL